MRRRIRAGLTIATVVALAAVVDVPVGDGNVVLLGTSVQHRAQAHGSFKLLFNAMLLGGEH